MIESIENVKVVAKYQPEESDPSEEHEAQDEKEDTKVEYENVELP